MRFTLLIIFCLISSLAISQTKETKDDKRSNSFEPFTPQITKKQQKSLKKKTTKKKRPFYKIFNKRMEKKKEDYYDRMEANAKKKRKIARKMEAPQYSDPSYFGHKKKPKKRKRGKRKFCKECGIVH